MCFIVEEVGLVLATTSIRTAKKHLSRVVTQCQVLFGKL